MSEKIIYKLNDNLLFRICAFEDCTNKERHWKEHTKKCIELSTLTGECMHRGAIHFHCPEHREVELSVRNSMKGPKGFSLVCVICETRGDGARDGLRYMTIVDIDTLEYQAKALVNSEIFKDARFIRLDDYYVPEISAKNLATKSSKYWVSYDVKETKDGRTLLIMYLGNREDKSKVQFFIEPETQKLTHDHKDTTPISVISRIEVEFKDGSIELKDKHDNTI